MALPVLPSVFRVAITHGTTLPSLAFTNVMHFTSAVLTPTQVLTALNGAAAAGMWAAKSSALAGTAAVVTKLDGSTPSIEGPLTDADWTGTAVGEVVPAVAVVITLRTTERGRRHTGRVFIGGIGEDVINNGSVAPATLSTMQGAWTTFIANCTSAGIPLTVASYGHDGTPPPPRPTRPAFTASSTLVNTAIAQATLGTQRRRQSKLRI